jgi:hypothetical protein
LDFKWDELKEKLIGNTNAIEAVVEALNKKFCVEIDAVNDRMSLSRKLWWKLCTRITKKTQSIWGRRRSNSK